ncbi:alpha/beta hydrolase [Nocardioides sp. QY071]|uniref:alpha/beta fold hydrolase n=1 Tax=Nocardioides sp. QY071 TaxID=3044187 RepID=UPI002499B931|nr:alpha/beta hydrolase [Nocardioides sp. QY071]WGY00401.1 alpha/beta hydrolase [Nocardioides sp. QY071]
MTPGGQTYSSSTGHLAVAGEQVGFTVLEPTRPSAEVPIVLLPGTGGPAATHYAFLAPMLAARRRVITVDYAPRHGDTPLTVEDLAGQVEAVTHHLDLRFPVLLCGYSLGAVVAAAVAARRPALVRQLVLVCGWAKTDGHQLLRNRLWHTVRKEGSAAGSELSVYAAYSPSYIAGRLPAEVDALVAAASYPDGIDAQMDLNRRVDIEHLLPAITAPTLVIGATHDQMTPVRQVKFLWGAIADARYAELPTGHAVMVERPAQVLQLVHDFIARPTAVPAGGVVTLDQP